MNQTRELIDSNVSWLGSIPADWSLPKLSYLFPYIGSGTTPKSDNEEYYGGTVPWVTTGELRENTIYETEKGVTDLALNEVSSLKIHPAGSVVVAMYGATIGRVAKLGVPATTNQACCVMPPSSKIDSEFLYFWLNGHRKEIVELGYGGGQPNISQTTISSLRIPLPSLNEQSEIVSFLNKQTARIDTLITEKQRFIDLLKEKRQALISHFVTKGLDANVPMRDSGVEWIGEVPEHWTVTRLKNFVEEHRQGYYTTEGYVDDGFPLLRISDFKGHTEIDLATPPRVPRASEAKRYFVRKGDFLFARTGGAGAFAVVPDLSEPTIYASYLIRFRFKNEVNSEFLRYALHSKPAQTEITKNIHGGVNQNIHAEDIKSALIAVPPLDEQGEIAEILSRESDKIDKILAEVAESLRLLHEHRTALISAAVTGKIDVRGMVNTKGVPA